MKKYFLVFEEGTAINSSQTFVRNFFYIASQSHGILNIYIAGSVAVIRTEESASETQLDYCSSMSERNVSSS
jgi:hypothetical protein